MSIERTQSSQQTDATERSDSTREARNDNRAPPLRENVDRFRTLMQDKAQREGKPETPVVKGRVAEGDAGENAKDAAAQRVTAADARDDEALRRSRDEKGLTSSALQAADASAMFQAQLAVRGDAIAQTHTPVNPGAFADMVERHVRQLAIGRHSGDAAGDGQVLLRMADSTLPGTDLLLSRTADGWMLRADVRSRNSYDAIKDAAPELSKRFAERNLGTLSIDPHFHG